MKLDLVILREMDINNAIVKAVEKATTDTDYLTCMTVDYVILKGKVGINFALAPHKNLLTAPPRIVQCVVGDKYHELFVRYLGDKDLMRSYRPPKITDTGDLLARDYTHDHFSHIWTDYAFDDKLFGLAYEITHFMTTGKLFEQSVIDGEFPAYGSTISSIKPAVLR